MSTTIDLNAFDADYESINPEDVILKPKEYRLRVAKAETKVSQEKGTTYIALAFTCPAEPDADLINDNLVMPDKERHSEEIQQFMLKRVKRALTALGATIKAGKVDVDTIVGKECFANVGTEEYEGRTKNVIKSYVLPSK